MIRHQLNTNLTLHYQDTYLGMLIQAEKGPFIVEYLGRLHQTISRAMNQYSRVFAFRFDLRFPFDMNPSAFIYENEVIDRFIESFKAKIRHNRQMALRENKYAHDSVVRYVWTREVGQLGRPHYHVAILLNYDAFCSLGRFSNGRDNMFNRLNAAWVSALGLSPDAVTGLVEIPQNPYYHLYRDDDESIAAFFYRASYLCKSETKAFGNGGHGFGASKI